MPPARPSDRDVVPASLAAAVDWAAARLEAAGLCFGHGADNPHTGAIILCAGATGLELEVLMADARRPLDEVARARLSRLVDERIATRRPAAYLAGRAWFAGLEFEVDERVLVPRSPLAEFLAEGGAPWLEPGRVERVLDVGTGSGCLAIAAAMAFPGAVVDAVDVSADALAVAARNVERHGLADRVRLLESDHFAAVAGERYDLILSNPPYIPLARMHELPQEYAHEPALALVSGEDGLDSVRAILQDAGLFLRPGGVLVVEVGEVEEAVAATWPELPFIWLEFEHGGSGVFLLTADALAQARAPAGR
jgi:ribosomal protein L3 glutamine methyltransferase